MKHCFSVENLEKTLGSRKIIKGISLQMHSGRVYGMIGPNSAGKTTLTKLLSGSLRPDQGSILLDGEPLQGKGPRDFIQQGVCAIYNDRVDLGNMKVEDFLLLSQATRRNPICISKNHRAIKQAKAMFARYGVSVDAKQYMREYSLGTQKLIELFMVMLCKPKVLVLDELDPWFEGAAKELFFQILEDLKNDDCIVLLISHELPTIQRACQIIGLVKGGELVSTEPSESMTAQKMVKDFFRTEKNALVRHNSRQGEVILQVENLSGLGIENISFSIREGDVIGLSGNRGAARASLAKTLMGEERYSGDVYIHGKKIKLDSPELAVNNGIAYITADIASEALFSGLSIMQNMLPRFMQHKGSKKQRDEIVEHYLSLLNIKDGEPDRSVSELSSGAQKKIVIARWLLSQSEVFIFERLSQNMDSIAIMDIFSIIMELQRMGKAIILISDHTKELIALSNIIHIFHNKSIKKTLKNKEITKENLLLYLTGNDQEESERSLIKT